MMMESGLKELVQYGNELAEPNFEVYGDIRYVDKKCTLWMDSIGPRRLK